MNDFEHVTPIRLKGRKKHTGKADCCLHCAAAAKRYPVTEEKDVSPKQDD